MSAPRLSIEEARDAWKFGVARTEARKAAGGVHRFGWRPAPDQERAFSGMSAVAERLVAAETGRAWSSCGWVPDAPEDGDVEGGISVRWTPYEHGSLIVHPDEPPTLRAVLVVGPTFSALRIVGWLWVLEAQRPEYWRPKSKRIRAAAFFVPQTAKIWRPLSELEA